jgi:hypothetical protein
MLSEDISKANLFLTGKWKTKVNWLDAYTPKRNLGMAKQRCLRS